MGRTAQEVVDVESFLTGLGGKGTLKGSVTNHTGTTSGNFWLYLKKANMESPEEYPAKGGTQIGNMHVLSTTRPPAKFNLNQSFESRKWVTLC